MHLCFSFFILMVEVDQINELLGFAKIAMVVGYAVVGGLLGSDPPNRPRFPPPGVSALCTICCVHPQWFTWGLPLALQPWLVF